MASPHRLLLIGDADHSLRTTLASAMPTAHVHAVPTCFDAIAELSSDESSYSAIFASAEPIERRPEAAVRILRNLSEQSRLILFGHPTLEPLSRKMLEFGADDYLITPAATQDLAELLTISRPTLTQPAPVAAPEVDGTHPELEMSAIVLDALLLHPHDAPGQVVRAINQKISPDRCLHYVAAGGAAPLANHAMMVLSHPIGPDAGTLYLSQPTDEDSASARQILTQVAPQIIRVVALQERHNRLQKLAITDELTGLYNGRYFRHFLSRILERGRVMRFPVTLLLFDIDNFKKYNDQFGHGAGDDILKQTAALMRRCCREHDLVARISGDEFAVIFWEKDPPRQPRDPQVISTSRIPTTPLIIFERFRKTLANHDFVCLGPQAKGSLTISGGLAVYPYDAGNPEDLIKAADEALMFGAKKSGKNSIHIVGPGRD